MDALRKAILASHRGWRPNLATLAGWMEYLKEKENAEVAKFRTLLEEHGQFCTAMNDQMGSEALKQKS